MMHRYLLKYIYSINLIGLAFNELLTFVGILSLSLQIYLFLDCI